MKILKWIGITVLSLLIIIAALVFFQIKKAEKIISQPIEIEPVLMEIPNDSLSLAIGKKWVTSMCAECHGDDLGGQKFIDDETIGKLYAPNLTPGEGGLAYYTDKNWLTALRHGVTPTGRPMMIMPSKDFARMRAEDIGGIISYIKTIPPVDRPNEENSFTPFAKLLVAMGAFDKDFSVYHIDHEAPVPANTADQTPFDRGEYLTTVIGCVSCHGKTLNGMPASDPNSPPASNITPGGNLGSWSYDDFTAFLQTGVTKEGKSIDNVFMPWKAVNKLPDEEVEALFTYLKSLDPLEAGF